MSKVVEVVEPQAELIPEGFRATVAYEYEGFPVFRENGKWVIAPADDIIVGRDTLMEIKILLDEWIAGNRAVFEDYK